MNNVFVALDLEMTGQDYERDDIIQVGAVRFDENRVLDRWKTLIKPSVSVSLRISRLTGIRSRDLHGAPSFEDIATHLRRFVGADPLVGHSIGHDVRFLESKGLDLSNPQYDTWELATLLIPSLSTYTLEGVAASLQVPVPRSHDAVADAEVSREVFLSLLDRLRDLPPELVAEICQLTRPIGWELYPLFESLQTVADPMVRAGGAKAGSIRTQLMAKGVNESDLTSLLFAPAQRVPPLEPRPEQSSLDPDELARVFDRDGALARTFDGYEERPQQVRMMRAVAEAFNSERMLLVEAGTGTGKSLAYLAPAARWALQNGERVVISTDTINLQDQLFNKDIPDVRRSLGPEGRSLKATLVKGRSNYLCLKRWTAYRRGGGFTPDEVRFIVKILLWLPNTATGDVAELPLGQEERVHWLKVCATQDTCTGRRCQFPGGKQCFLFRARQEAEGSHLIVVNHSLMLSDIAADNTVLPSYGYLVVDEAHKLEAQATEQLGFSLDQRFLQDHLDRISRGSTTDHPEGLASTLPVHLRGSRVQTDAANQVLSRSTELAERTARSRTRADDFFASLGPVLSGLPVGTPYDQHLRLTPEQRALPSWEHVLTTWDNLKLAMTDLQATIQAANELFEDFDGLNVISYDEVMAELQSLAQTNAAVLQRTDAVIDQPRAEDVCWLTVSARSGAVQIRQAPLHVGALLQDNLYTQKRSIVLTSATLSTDNSFSYVEERLGLTDTDELIVGSAFDYRRSTLLLLPTDMPEPGNQGYQKALEAAIVELVSAAEGRSLVLFTSHSAVQTTLKGVRRPLAQQDILVLGHSDGPRHRLLQQFRSNPRTVLLGTRSFWEGVDVVGDALSLLIIAKLPFEVPSDPVFTARSESFENSFANYAIPQAILRLKQGFGRLIRSKDDRGVVVAMDRRLLSKSYGGEFLRSLPSCTSRKGPLHLLPAEVETWLQAPRTVHVASAAE